MLIVVKLILETLKNYLTNLNLVKRKLFATDFKVFLLKPFPIKAFLAIIKILGGEMAAV